MRDDATHQPGRFANALTFTTSLHATQTRKGSDTPYIAHLLAVAAIVLEHGGTEDEAIAALLHDAVEDQGGAAMLAKLRARYGGAVAGIVAGCTDTDEIPKPPWRPRKEQHIAHLRRAPYSVRLVAAADKLHNARSVLADYRVLGEDLWSRFTGGREGMLWFYQAVLEAMRDASAPGEERLDWLLDELERTVTELNLAATQQISSAMADRPKRVTGT